MKKIRNAIVLILVIVITAVGGVLFIHFSEQNRLEEIFSGKKTDISADELVLDGDRVKAPTAEELLWLNEKEMAFDGENAKTKKQLKAIDRDFFGGVILKSSYYSSEKADEKSEEKEKLTAFTAYLKSEGFMVFAEVDLSFSAEEIRDIMSFTDGVILSGGDKLKTEKLNSTLLKIKAAAELEMLKSESYVALPLDYDYVKLNKKSVDGVYLTASSPDEGKKLAEWDKSMKIAGVKIMSGFSFKKDMSCDTPLKSLYELQQCQSVKARAYSGLKYITENKDNSFGALKQYITGGIIPEMAFRKLRITGYSGETEKTSELSKEIELYGSNLYPVYEGGKKISLGENGSRIIALTYTEGENIFTYSQGENEVDYSLHFTFDGEIIRSVFPTGEISAAPNESVTVMIVAFSQADIKVKLGTKTFKTTPYDKDTMGYTVFAAKIKMPDTVEEIESLGMITVIGSYGEKSEQSKGAMVTARQQEITTTAPKAEETKQTTTYALIGNYSPNLPDEAYTVATTLTQTQPQTVITTEPQHVSQFTPYTGTQMCVVTAAYADTWPLISGDDTYVPYYAPLVAGTVDYVTAESEAYNSEEEETVYFYELASGRKVKRKDVQLIPKTDLGANSMNVLSSYSDGGTTKVTFSTSRKIPYDINYTPQNYFSGYWKKYNVSSFTASQIQLTFYYTTAITGNLDFSGSDVVSSAQLSYSAGNTVLTLCLRQAGVYYGCSIEYDASGNLVLTVHDRPQGISGAVILLDPGHGGDEPGAVGIGAQVKEKDVNYAIAYYTKLALESKGATVYMTRGGDDTLSLEQRKQIARSLKPDLFIAIHNNGSENSSNIGTSTYYYKPFSYNLAANIYDCLLSTYKNNIYAGRSELFSEIADGTIYYPFSVTRLEGCPSVLLEVGYMTNDSECYELIKTENQMLFAEAIAKGVERTLAS